MKKIYVGNLPFSATESQVRELFGKHGDVASVALGPLKREADLIMEALLREYYGSRYFGQAARR